MRFLKETDEGVAEVCEIMEKYGAKREARGEERGEKRGKLMVVIDLLKDGIISEQVAADKVGMTVDEFKKEMEAYLPVQWKHRGVVIIGGYFKFV